MMFEDWHKFYDPFKNDTFDLDLREAYEAGWNSCAYKRSDETYKEYLKGPNND
jgi:hypothetical protein